MFPSRRSCRMLIIFTGAIPFACAIGLCFTWRADNALLRTQAMAITAHLDTDSARIRAVNDWVYHNQGFDKNHHYFLVPALGPTPVQVIQHGGDCADKSRLVAAMLNNLGAVAINWDRDVVTRGIAATLQLIGYQPETSLRPRMLEDPKLFLILVLLATTTVIVLGSFVLGLAVGAKTKGADKHLQRGGIRTDLA